jgi:hypothetical protein
MQQLALLTYHVPAGPVPQPLASASSHKASAYTHCQSAVLTDPCAGRGGNGHMVTCPPVRCSTVQHLLTVAGPVTYPAPGLLQAGHGLMKLYHMHGCCVSTLETLEDVAPTHPWSSGIRKEGEGGGGGWGRGAHLACLRVWGCRCVAVVGLVPLPQLSKKGGHNTMQTCQDVVITRCWHLVHVEHCQVNSTGKSLTLPTVASTPCRLAGEGV